ELARQKNMKKSQEISKGKRKEDSLTTSQRKQKDSDHFNWNSITSTSFVCSDAS
ncbi:hypothetical protein FD755_001787, partial [Muntiacus reevesi]